MQKCYNVKRTKINNNNFYSAINKSGVEYMICKIHFLPALAGDCFVLEFDNKDCILIDCGYSSTYVEYLRPLLIRLNGEGCRIVLMIVTHIDQDHIQGAVEFIRENGQADHFQIIEVQEIWFNGFFNTLFREPEFNKRVGVTNIEDGKLKKLQRNLRLQNIGTNGTVSAADSVSFESLCVKNGYAINASFVDGIAKRDYSSYEEKKDHTKQFGDISVRILNPDDKRLHELANKLDVYLMRCFGKGYCIEKTEQFAKLFELLRSAKQEIVDSTRKISAGSTDIKSWLNSSKLAAMNAENRASIVVEIEYHGYCFLFTGDAESMDWIPYIDKEYSVVKASHHGTTKPNMAMLEHTQIDKLLISTNGSKHMRHPDDEFLARAILGACKELYFNYDIARKNVLIAQQEQYGYRVHFDEREILIEEQK